MDIRCFSCSTPIGQLESEYCRRIEQGAHAGDALDALGIMSICCRKEFIGYAAQLRETLAIMSTQEVANSSENCPMKINYQNTSNRTVSSG